MIDLIEKLDGREGFCTAVDAMINGLKNQSERAGFTVSMNSYGEAHGITAYGEIMCFGCAATCAIQEYAGVNFNYRSIPNERARALAINVDVDILAEFEISIEWLRGGHAYKLSNFCQLDEDDHHSVNRYFVALPELTNENWDGYLLEYETALCELRRHWDVAA